MCRWCSFSRRLNFCHILGQLNICGNDSVPGYHFICACLRNVCYRLNAFGFLVFHVLSPFFYSLFGSFLHLLPFLFTYFFRVQFIQSVQQIAFLLRSKMDSINWMIIIYIYLQMDRKINTDARLTNFQITYFSFLIDT